MYVTCNLYPKGRTVLGRIAVPSAPVARRPSPMGKLVGKVSGDEKSVAAIDCGYRARFASTGKPAFFNSLINCSFQPSESSILMYTTPS